MRNLKYVWVISLLSFGFLYSAGKVSEEESVFPARKAYNNCDLEKLEKLIKENPNASFCWEAIMPEGEKEKYNIKSWSVDNKCNGDKKKLEKRNTMSADKFECY